MSEKGKLIRACNDVASWLWVTAILAGFIWIYPGVLIGGTLFGTMIVGTAALYASYRLARSVIRFAELIGRMKERGR